MKVNSIQCKLIVSIQILIKIPGPTSIRRAYIRRVYFLTHLPFNWLIGFFGTKSNYKYATETDQVLWRPNSANMKNMFLFYPGEPSIKIIGVKYNAIYIINI